MHMYGSAGCTWTWTWTCPRACTPWSARVLTFSLAVPTRWYTAEVPRHIVADVRNTYSGQRSRHSVGCDASTPSASHATSAAHTSIETKMPNPIRWLHTLVVSLCSWKRDHRAARRSWSVRYAVRMYGRLKSAEMSMNFTFDRALLQYPSAILNISVNSALLERSMPFAEVMPSRRSLLALCAERSSLALEHRLTMSAGVWTERRVSGPISEPCVDLARSFSPQLFFLLTIPRHSSPTTQPPSPVPAPPPPPYNHGPGPGGWRSDAASTTPELTPRERASQPLLGTRGRPTSTPHNTGSHTGSRHSAARASPSAPDAPRRA